MFLVEKAQLSSHFRSLKKKQSSVLKDYQLAARSFDEKVILKLKTLIPTSNSLSWLCKAVAFLSAVHSEALDQISDNVKSESDDYQALYVDYSMKVLSLCNLISSAVRQLTDRRLLTNLSLRLLDLSGQIPTVEKLNKAKDTLTRSVCVPVNNTSVEEKGRQAASLIGELAAALGNLPSRKTKTARDLMRRTLYALGALTVFVAGVLVAVLYGLDDVVKVRVPAEFLWADSVNGVQTHVFDLISKQKKKGRLVELNEMASKAVAVRDVLDGDGEGDLKDMVRLEKGVNELETAAKEFSDGIEGLTNGVDGLFSTVLETRNGVLDNTVRKGLPL